MHENTGASTNRQKWLIAYSLSDKNKLASANLRMLTAPTSTHNAPASAPKLCPQSTIPRHREWPVDAAKSTDGPPAEQTKRLPLHHTRDKNTPWSCASSCGRGSCAAPEMLIPRNQSAFDASPWASDACPRRKRVRPQGGPPQMPTRHDLARPSNRRDSRSGPLPGPLRSALGSRNPRGHEPHSEASRSPQHTCRG